MSPKLSPQRLLLQTLLTIPNIDGRRITILTDYRAQVRLLQEMAKRHGWSNVGVRTIDESQGFENEIIIYIITRRGTALGLLNQKQRATQAEQSSR